MLTDNNGNPLGEQMAIELQTDLIRATSEFMASSRDPRYLKGMLIEVTPDRWVLSVATDGHTMFVGYHGEHEHEAGQWIVPGNVVTDALKIVRKAPVMRFDPQHFGPIVYRPIDAEYPNWRRVLPPPKFAPEETGAAQLNPEHVGRLAKVAKHFGRLPGEAVILHNGPNHVAHAYIDGEQHRHVVIIMPMRGEIRREAVEHFVMGVTK